MIRATPKQIAALAAGKAAPVTEEEFMAQVIALAGLRGWLAYHTRDSRQCVAGFPDLVLVKPGRGICYAELKSAAGKLTTAQKAWLLALTAAGADCRVWRPADWDEIEQTLGD